MSHSSFVRVAIGEVALEFTYGSRSVADEFGVPVHEEDYVEGQAARNWINDNMRLRADVFPDAHVALVMQVLAAHDAGFGDDERVEYERVFNSIRVSIKHFD